MFNTWKEFNQGIWTKEINVRDFIQQNYTEYLGDDSFLTDPTENTKYLWQEVLDLLEQEKNNGGVLDADTKVISSIVSHKAGYIDQDREQIVGLQTDKPLKRALQPYGGIRTSESALESYGYEIDPEVDEIFTKYRKSHNQGVFDAYTPEIRAARKTGVITGLPDAYGRGRIIGDYRRVALYGINRLIEDKKSQINEMPFTMTPENIQLREELAEQIKSLKQLVVMAKEYGFDITRPAENAQEAIQWLYFGYLGAIKEQNGAAMSIGRVSSFLDIYIQRDLSKGLITEDLAQEYMDHFIMKLRMVKFMRSPDYNALFSGDPTWVTEAIGGMGLDGRSLVTKNSFRILHSLVNLGPAPEPNLTVLWSTHLPAPFKQFCAKTSISTSSVQYENDDLMRQTYGDDYAIACCVSAMRVGKEMQYFGARANIAKALLYAINGGVDELSKTQVGPKIRKIEGDYLDYDEVMERYEETLEWLAELYANTLNIIHYMHDKYAYEAIQMAFHDRDVKRNFATGIAGLSVVADSLSAIKFAKVKPVRDENGVAIDFVTEGEFPKFGNNDDRVDEIAAEIVEKFMNMIRRQFHLRNSHASMSVLTITSNVVYGKKTGSTPDGRKKGEPFAPGANPMHGRDKSGALASLSSVAKIPYQHAQDGISNTFSIIPDSLGKSEDIEICNPFKNVCM
ncbi:formate C-acetyltransferase [Mycoplasma sp. P36-A1]|uniref:formate C-acetyltransferase n=1 Tax=Mycoplasma sp. P36-A1 TaxID=3252900 RepID=UPI003C3092D3